MATENEYVLGTDEAERVRLGLQHRLWSAQAFACWERAGIKPGLTGKATDLKFISTTVDGAFIIEPEPRRDERGYFARIWCAAELARQGLVSAVAQVNTGVSPRRGTLRGLHFQAAPHEEVKIARCMRGAAFDVVVDLRRRSPTFRKWYGLELTGDNARMLYVPEGCAHGYLTLADDTELMYMTSHPYVPGAASGVRFDDPALGIAWPLVPEIVSEPDRSWPLFAADASRD